MMMWNKVEEKVPDYAFEEDVTDDVLIIFHSKCSHCGDLKGDQYYGIGWFDENGWYLTEPLDSDWYPADYEKTIEVTHWMTLPNKPRNIKKERVK